MEISSKRMATKNAKERMYRMMAQLINPHQHSSKNDKKK